MDWFPVVRGSPLARASTLGSGAEHPLATPNPNVTARIIRKTYPSFVVEVYQDDRLRSVVEDSVKQDAWRRLKDSVSRGCAICLTALSLPELKDVATMTSLPYAGMARALRRRSRHADPALVPELRAELARRHVLF